MSVNPVEGAVKAIEIKKMTPIERTNVKTDLQNDERATQERAVEPSKLSAGVTPEELLKDEIKEINYTMKLENRHCEFRYVEEVNRVAIKVINTDTDEVIKEIPSEEALKTMQALRELNSGLVDEKL